MNIYVLAKPFLIETMSISNDESLCLFREFTSLPDILNLRVRKCSFKDSILFVTRQL